MLLLKVSQPRHFSAEQPISRWSSGSSMNPAQPWRQQQRPTAQGHLPLLQLLLTNMPRKLLPKLPGSVALQHCWDTRGVQ
jgi:hypothetical protein